MALRCVLIAIAVLAGCKSHEVANRPFATVAGSHLWSGRDVRGYDPREVIALSIARSSDFSGEDYGSAHFQDIMAHTPADKRWSKDGAAPTTIAHETHHRLQAHHSRVDPDNTRFFYFERGFGARVRRPKQNLRLVRTESNGVNVYTEDAYTDTTVIRERVPERVRQLAKLRYEVYMMDPERARYGVLVVFDEWNAYLASARVAIEIYDAGLYYPESRSTEGTRQTVRQIGELDGMVDFLYFASAGIAALHNTEPDYLRDNEQLRAVYAVFAEETMHWLSRGRTIDLFSGFHAERLREHFVTSVENREIRRVLRGWLGPEWTRRVLGF